ncbi:LysR family transcriptional regulator [Sphingomonas palmae]|uniref:LysR family transcriptional regulator n=1 Tax=Sphingomonas palmae TaxID=1855283 RepID=UPI0015A63128|nr:LysR family transcriptional regulator [Sphingomonas palmae]
MTDRFEDLRTFVTVISCGGVNAAAAELGIAKSAVSRRLSELEERLGASLVERSTRRFEPTALGLEYYKRAGDILASLEQLDAAIAAAPNGGATLTISAAQPVVTHVLLPALASTAFLEATSSLRLKIVPRQSGVAGDADMIVSEEPVSGWESRPLLSTVLKVCGSPAYLAGRPSITDPSAFHGHVSIAWDGTTDWRLRDRARKAPAAALTTATVIEAKAAALAGFGLAQLPDFLVAEEMRDGSLVAVLQDLEPPATQLRVFYAADAELSTRQAVDALSAQAV